MILQTEHEASHESLTLALLSLGVQAGDTLLVHSSFRAVGVRDPEEVIGALLAALGPRGTLLLPALSYRQQPPLVHDTRLTPSCVGFLSEYFRTRAGTVRSLHPTHSVCAVGAWAEAMTRDHYKDDTPCGPRSPFRRLIEARGKILMLGCGLSPNTTMHAVEEGVAPPYLFGPEMEYVLTDRHGVARRKRYHTHGFEGVRQRYDRVASLLGGDELRVGRVGAAPCHLLAAEALDRHGAEKIREDPLYFVEKQDA